jgi:hypothetical protein
MSVATDPVPTAHPPHPRLRPPEAQKRPGPGTSPRGRGYSVFARADGPAGPRLRPGTSRRFLSFGRLGRQAVAGRHFRQARALETHGRS